MCCCKIINLKTTSKENKIPQWRIIRGGNSWVVGWAVFKLLISISHVIKIIIGLGYTHIIGAGGPSLWKWKPHSWKNANTSLKPIKTNIKWFILIIFLYFNFSSVCLFLVALKGTSFLSGFQESRPEFQRAWPHRHLWTIFTSCFFAMGLSFQLIWAIEMLLEAGNLHNYRK